MKTLYLWAVLLAAVVVCGTAAEAESLLQAEELGRGRVLVTGKSPNCLMVADHGGAVPGGRVLVTRASRLLDIDDTALSLRALQVPCVARLELSAVYGSPTLPAVRTLRVLEYAPTADAAFTSHDPCQESPE